MTDASVLLRSTSGIVRLAGGAMTVRCLACHHLSKCVGVLMNPIFLSEFAESATNSNNAAVSQVKAFL